MRPIPNFLAGGGGGGGGGIYGGNAADTEGDDGSGSVLSSVFCGSQEEEERRGWYGNWLEEKRESTFSVESPSESDAGHGTGECNGLGLDLFFNFSNDFKFKYSCFEGYTLVHFKKITFLFLEGRKKIITIMVEIFQ